MLKISEIHGLYTTLLVTIVSFMCSCDMDNKEADKINRFEVIESSHSGIQFSNDLIETDSLNYFIYPYMYMGGGAAIGDINNDGLSDVFFTGNLVSNKLYLNQGDLKFEDISENAKISGSKKWYSGVSMVDINADGYLDIYLCVSGKHTNKENELYINNKDLTFTESAKEYGLNDAGNSVQSSFFDYDHDGDLDVYVANYPLTSFNTPNTTYRFLVSNPKLESSDHLYENLGNGKFQDKTIESGLLSFGLSLSATVADFNKDGWDDIYVSNDFSTPDYFYINNGDGTFKEKLKSITNQTSFYGMGTDAADINNDGLIDLMQVDMSAPDNRRTKANMASMNPSLFWSTVNNGFHYQYMYNSLQLNQGLNGNLPVMSNIAWMAGVSSTDWSWAPLIADFDNDGWKDMYVANGTRKEINNRDYFKKIGDQLETATPSELKKIADDIPSEPIANFMFKNMGGTTFEKINEDWNIDFVGFSNGVSYGDLDNDGDLDLVVSNIDDKATVYRNNTAQINAENYLRIKVKGSGQNLLGIGTEAHVYTNGIEQVSQLFLTRGFQSSTEPYLHFGVGNLTQIDSIAVFYQGKLVTTLSNIPSNQAITVDLNNSTVATNKIDTSSTQYFNDISEKIGLSIYHQENSFNDFDYQVLIPHKMSNFGPALAVGDVNGDGLDDIYMGAAVDSNGQLLLQKKSGGFDAISFQSDKDKVYEDIDATFTDLDNDGDLDLYVVSGGNEYEQESVNYQDRIYLNAGGKLTLANEILPAMYTSGACVRPHDFDGDGDIDLFVGGRLDPRNYPYSGTSYLLENKLENGKLKFVEVTDALANGLSKIGMVTDATWSDINQDGNKDLIVVGEWMPITVFEYNNGKYSNKSDQYFKTNTTGWWFSIESADIDKDGDQDFVVGNLGLNYKYKAKTKEPFTLYAADFDHNGKHDIILSYYNYGIEYPVRGRQCSSDQIPAIKVAYKDYNSFAVASTEDIFGTDNLDSAMTFKVESFESVIIENKGNNSMELRSLPLQTQISSINDILVDDFTGDGHLDIVVAGNLFASEVETPRSDAGIGLLLEGDGKGNFNPLTLQKSGILIPYDLKKLKSINIDNKTGFVAASNNGPLQVFAK